MNSNVPEKVIRAASGVARNSNCVEFRHGAVVFKRNRIIATAFNNEKTHPNGCGFNSTHHAEFAAILKAKKSEKSLRGLSIYVIRINKNGQTRFSKPCPDCMRHINDAELIPFWSEEDDKEVDQKCRKCYIDLSKMQLYSESQVIGGSLTKAVAPIFSTF